MNGLAKLSPAVSRASKGGARTGKEHGGGQREVSPRVKLFVKGKRGGGNAARRGELTEMRIST